MSDTFYRCRSVRFSWHSFGDILVAGMFYWPPEEESERRYYRSGPVVPPISFPSASIVVTDAFAEQLRKSGLSGFSESSFVEIEKKHIVRIPWEDWDREKDPADAIPLSMLPYGGPEGLVLEPPHDEELARQIGRLWELQPYHIEQEYYGYGPRVITSVHYLPDVFEHCGDCHVSDTGFRWLQSAASEWIVFQEVPVTYV